MVNDRQIAALNRHNRLIRRLALRYIAKIYPVSGGPGRIGPARYMNLVN